MGIALGSAVKTASMLNVDNRIMYRIGTVARAMKMVEWDFVMGVPLVGDRQEHLLRPLEMANHFQQGC
jgi:uncharacterized ferredoxin-like protein